MEKLGEWNMRKIEKLLFCAILCAASYVNTIEAKGDEMTSSNVVKSVRVTLPEKPSDRLKSIVSVFARQLQKRCQTKVTTQETAALTVMISIDPAIGKEGFRISDHADGGIEVAGQNELGVLYGLGKLLRTSRYSKDGFAPGYWRGLSVPKKPIRGIYFATHFHNFYHDGPIDEIQNYVEEVALWGCNNLMVWYDMNHFNGFDDPKAVAFRKRLDGILKTANNLGLGTAFIMIGNEGYNNSPQDIRSEGGGRGGFYPSAVCPNKPGGTEYGLQVQEDMMEWMAAYNPQYLCLWPFDQGGCNCEHCRPWATKGFLKCAKAIAQLAHKKIPEAKIILSNWYYKKGEVKELGTLLKKDGDWVDLVMAAVPGTEIPAVNFPEISMLGVQPWGGFGSIPVPQHLQNKYAKMDNLKGGWPYSEGLFEDMNKAVMLQLFWDPKQPTIETLRRYASFEFSPQVANNVVAMVTILEKNFRGRKNIGATAIKAYELAKKVDAQLPPDIRKSWRWRILYLRALIDKEMHLSKGALKGKILKDSFAELTDIYHAENALPGWLIPPKVTDDSGEAKNTNTHLDLDLEQR
jgi:hypothetical protein